jgi:hypothetical protein
MTEGLPAPAGGEIAFRRHLRETMLERVNGTFLWVGFAMHELRKRRTSTEILAALEDLPSGLGNIYGSERDEFENLDVGYNGPAATGIGRIGSCNKYSILVFYNHARPGHPRRSPSMCTSSTDTKRKEGS